MPGMFSTQTTQALVNLCKQERKEFQRSHIPASPACMELFRRAFASDQEAWSAMCHTFEKMMISWIGIQQDVEQEEALQLAWLDFSRSAPKRPELVSTDNLAPLMEFLKRSAKTAVLQLRRAQKRQAWAVSLDLLTAATDQGSDDGSWQNLHDQQRLYEVLEDSQRWTDTVDVRLTLQQRLRELVQDRLEQQIFDLLVLYLSWLKFDGEVDEHERR